MRDALVGHSGFVGSTLQRQTSFDSLYRSTNIDEIVGQSFDTVICAGAPAQKWLANREPEEDSRKIDGLIKRLDTIRCRTFILISTVDVFRQPLGITESSAVDETGLHPYGLHRRRLEKYVQARFADHLVVRLPGLVGPCLRKNVIFDLLHQNNLAAIDSRGVFQFYPVANLWHDIQTARRARLPLVHLTAEPVSVADIALQCFGMQMQQAQAGAPAIYDMRTEHAACFGARGDYQCTSRESLLAIRTYAQVERMVARETVGALA